MQLEELSAPTISFHQRQHIAHMERRAKWSQIAPKKEPAPMMRLKPSAEPKDLPSWATTFTRFDDHIRRHEWHVAQRSGSGAAYHIKIRCTDFGIPHAILIGSTRRREITNKRQLIMWEVHELFGLSFPAIGRLFGGRDHTTALHAFRKIDAMTPEQRAAL